MYGHYLVEPVASTPASGWEKGRVENQAGLVRERFFTPGLRFKSYDELNAWLEERCLAYARRAMHPERKGKTIRQVFEEAERFALIVRGISGLILTQNWTSNFPWFGSRMGFGDQPLAGSAFAFRAGLPRFLGGSNKLMVALVRLQSSVCDGA